MEFQLPYPSKPNIFLPFHTHGRNYHLLFSERVKMNRKLSVVDSEITAQSFFHIGELREDGYEGTRCGFIFYSPMPVQCHGTSIFSYSKQWARSVNEKRFPLNPFGVALVLKAEYFYLYHKRNQVSLVVSPNMAKKIRDNLEI
jgi:hypothetical protein